MSKTAIATNLAPAAIGPYSQGVRVGGLVFTAGQIPLDPATQQVVRPGITEQTTQVMENLKAIVEAAGSSLARVVKAVDEEIVTGFTDESRVIETRIATIKASVGND